MGSTRQARDARTYARRRMAVAGVVAVLLALVAGLFVVPRLVDSPERARRTFVEALAAGDTGKLVGVTRDLPQSARAAVAAMQAAGGLPTNPRTTADGVAFDLAGAHHEVALPVEKVDGRWKVSTPTATLSLAGFPVAARIDGAPVTAPDHALLPGVHVVESADPLLTFPPATVVVTDPAAPAGVAPAVPALSEAGLAAVRRAASESLAACLAKKGIAVTGCPNVASPPPGLVLDEAAVSWELAGQDPTTSLALALDKGKAWGTSKPIDIPLKATAPAIRKYDATATTYAQPITVRARVFASIANGAVTVTWTE